MTKPRKHAEYIRAWAKGREVIADGVLAKCPGDILRASSCELQQYATVVFKAGVWRLGAVQAPPLDRTSPDIMYLDRPPQDRHPHASLIHQWANDDNLEAIAKGDFVKFGDTEGAFVPHYEYELVPTPRQILYKARNASKWEITSLCYSKLEDFKKCDVEMMFVDAPS